MPHPSKRKANRHERELVKIAEAKGMEAERAYASNGESLGEVEACDVLVTAPNYLTHIPNLE